MTQNTTTAKAHKAAPAGTFNMRMGNTTYVVGVHFSKDSKDTLEDKMERKVLIMQSMYVSLMQIYF